KINDEYTWTFQSSVQQPPSYFEITAKDYAGNEQVFRKTLALVQDHSQPSLAGAEGVRTNHFYAGKSYLGKTNNTLQIEIADSGSGITRSGVIIDLSKLNPGYSAQEFPDSCEILSNGNFLCEKYDLDSNLVEGVVEVKVTVMDKAGNILPAQSTNIYVDKIKPVISSITQNMPLPTAADEGSFGFLIDALETNPIIVSADTSSFSDDGISQVICPSSTNCLFSPNDINPLSGEKTITIRVSDIAGNFVEKDYTFSLYQLAQCNVYGDGLVSMSAGTPNPKSLDRRLASYKPFRIYVPLQLTHDPNIEVADILVQYCANVPGITLGDYQIITGDADNPFFLVSASVSTGTIPTEFPLACNFSLQIVHGDTKCINLEDEYFNFTIPLENFPLGDIGGEAQEKITGVEGRIQRLRDKIHEKEKKLNWIKNWCKLVESMHYADSAAQAIKSILFGVGCVVSKLPYVGEAGKVIWQAGCYIGNIFGTLTSTLFWSKYYLPTDEQSVKEILGIGNKYLCIVYSCKLCNIGELVKIGVGMAGDVSRGLAGSDTSNLNSKGTEDKSQDRPAEPATEDTGRRDAMKEEDNWWEGVDEFEGTEEWPEDWGDADGEWVDEPSERVLAEPETTYDFSKFKEGSHYFHYGDSANRGKTDFYQDMSKATDLGAGYLDSSKYTWDPFKSVHYANACFCERGIIFNLRKERQIECIYRDCLKSHLEQGLPTTSCEIAKKEQECLYIDSAEYKLYGFFNWEKLWQAAVKSLAAYAYNQAFEALCGDYYKWKKAQSNRCDETKDEPCQGVQDALCGVAEAIVEVGELYSVYVQAQELWQPPEIEEVYC
ncbi:hypothetical protein KY326_01595, partial [Candidatus Woesearchaeota archaeon]|nr:hypothetical protein [Candidatus Woesearchaeota archaeon]